MHNPLASYAALVAVFLCVTAAAQAPPGAEPSATGSEPPPVQFLVPGFTVHKLPVELTNINNVKYRADGTLVALGYDGRVWLLRDTDGDGLEDQISEFWSNPTGLRAAIGMDLTPPGYEHGNGVFINSKTSCLLVVDTDGDDRADRELVVADGWKESFHAVDGLGVAYDPRDGSVYYGRGTYNFSDPLLRDEQGQPHYSLTDESSAIIRVSPDFKERTIVATGIRFPVAIRFNRQGDLFATDQEGATWVPNGNPFDELLHIQPGRHYGFPARHPEHLPNVIDEPSTYDYGPQHQSTCGLNFNEPVIENGPVFGPSAWRGDALVAGYARGKLYRTELVKTPAGYVARNHLLACLNLLTVDACVGPRGELIVACHSGGPDWGSGPTGDGTLYKVHYSDPEHPQPSLAWPAGPRELRVEFDRPLEAGLLKDVLTTARLTAGAFVRAGDRFESLWPGYANVEKQKLSPIHNVPIHSAQLTPDGRSLVLLTGPLTSAVHYALTLPGMGRSEHNPQLGDALRQDAAIDVDFDLTGCAATWNPADGGAPWTGWLPHLDLEVAREFTTGSQPHAALWDSMDQPGELVLRTRLDLANMLRPEVQPNSELDYELPLEVVHVLLETSSDATLELADLPDFVIQSRDGSRASFILPADAPRQLDITVQLKTRGSGVPLHVSWTTDEDDTPRPLPLRRQLVPWSHSENNGQLVDTGPPPELEGGDWERGRLVFFSDDAACSKCHTIYGRGGQIGPDLSNLVHRDYASVLRDITRPSFAINPDHVSSVVVLNDGRVLSGVVRTAEGQFAIGDIKGNVTVVDRDDVEEITASPVSTMPEELPKLLGPERLRDLMTFLLTPAPKDFVWP